MHDVPAGLLSTQEVIEFNKGVMYWLGGEICPERSYRWLHSQNKVCSATANECREADYDETLKV